MQRRTVGVLSGGVALGGIGVTVGITVGGLLARDVAGTDTAAGLGQTAAVLGSAVLAVPLARISDRSGRRAGLAAGYAVAVLGAALTVVAAALSSLPLLLVGLFAFGAATACGLQARYAAADLAAPDRRGRALALVVWATTVGSVLGPNLAGPGADLGRALGLPGAGRRLRRRRLVVFAVVAAGLLLPAPARSAAARPPAGRRDRGAGRAPAPGHARPRCARCGPHPAGRLGLTSVVVSHAVMVGVMVMTPVHMGHAGGSEGTTLRIIGLVISVHVAGHVPVLAAGRAARRPRGPDGDGRRRRRAAAGRRGAGRHGAAPGAAVQLGIGLFLLGLGWSCGLIAGSTLVTESVGPERAADRAGRHRPADGARCGAGRGRRRAAAGRRRLRPGRGASRRRWSCRWSWCGSAAPGRRLSGPGSS